METYLYLRVNEDSGSWFMVRKKELGCYGCYSRKPLLPCTLLDELM